MRTTLKQVADDTGLSIATVSRALRRNKRRYSKNEERIYASARKLGYPFIGELNNEEQLTIALVTEVHQGCLLYTSPSPRDVRSSRMPSSA